MGTPLTNIKGIGESTAKDMQTHGIADVEELATCSVDEIVAVPGFGATRARRIKEAAATLLQTAQDTPAGMTQEPLQAVQNSAEAAQESANEEEKEREKKPKDKGKKEKKGKKGKKKKKGKK